MAKLIDVEKAIINFGFEWDDISPTREEFIEFLKRQPDAVVHCKDCKHSGKGRGNNYMRCNCDNGLDGPVDPDEYCSVGVRRENDGN